MQNNQNNQDKLKEKYTQYRIKMKSLKPGAERSLVKNELSDFLESVSLCFGQDVVDNLTRQKK
jgi:hypothetical protein